MASLASLTRRRGTPSLEAQQALAAAAAALAAAQVRAGDVQALRQDWQQLRADSAR